MSLREETPPQKTKHRISCYLRTPFKKWAPPPPPQQLTFWFVTPRHASLIDTEVSAPILVQHLTTNTVLYLSEPVT
jgi:hypothetical protein